MDDNTCIEMANSTEEGCVADVYVEALATQDMSEDSKFDDSDYEDEMGSDEDSEEDDDMEQDAMNEDLDIGAGPIVLPSTSESREKVDKQIRFVKEFYSPSKGKGKVKVGDSGPVDGDNGGQM